MTIMQHYEQPAIVCPLHWYYDHGHLDHVIEQMRVLGSPRLRGFHDRETGCYMLREGTHRIRAAHLLGVEPVIVVIPWWRTKAALERARHAAERRGLAFGRVRLGTKATC